MTHTITPELKLLLNAQTQTDSLESCWMEGFAIAQAEGEFDLNPFRRNSTEARFWEEGYMAGLLNEAPLFPEYAVSISLHHEPEQNVQNDQNFNLKKWLNKSKWFAASVAATGLGTLVITTDLLELAAA